MTTLRLPSPLPLSAVLATLIRVGSGASTARQDTEGAMAEYRIDDLARAAGMTTRNVRAYQGLGLLPSPRRVGRIAIYTDVHLARLRLIGSLLERGYTSAQISELIGAWEQGRDLTDVLGIEEALVTPFSDELPTYLPVAEVRSTLDDEADFDRAVALGLVKVEGDQCLVRRPQLLNAMQELGTFGFPVSTSLDLHSQITPLLDRISDLMVAAATDQLTDHVGPGFVPSNEQVAELGPILQRLRQLAMTTMQLTLAQSLESSIQRQLGEFFGKMSPTPATAEVTPRTDG